MPLPSSAGALDPPNAGALDPPESCPRKGCCVSWRLSLQSGQNQMQKIGFAEALDSIVASDPRYQRDAYVFLRDALDYTTKQQKKTKGASVRHVAGPELLE